MYNKYMILTERHKFIKYILDKILKSTTIDELEQVRIDLEINPFCGLDMCYDLEHTVYHIFDEPQRKMVLDHIDTLIGEPKVHIFTTLEFLESLSKKEKLSMDDIHFITILTGNTERDEYINRIKNNKIQNSIISGLLPNNITNVENLETVLLNADADHVASDYYTTIINYLKLFPNYMPVYIDRLTPISVLITKKMNDRKILNPDFKWLGSILKGHETESLESLNIHYFQNGLQLLDILENITVLHN
jgi:hypothetical protein